MSKSVLMGVAVVAMLGSACNRDAANAPHDAAAAATPRNDVRFSAAEQEFVQKAVKGNKMEAELAEMAKGKASNDAVEDFAQMLERDHEKALEELRAIADKGDIKIDEAPPVEKASMDSKLHAATGAAFDREYIVMMVDAHKKNIASTEQMQATATGELKEFIDEMLPVMREHLAKAESLAASVAK
jgi:putative membrane protein